MKTQPLFENTVLALQGEHVFANRKQLQKLYDVSKKALAKIINDLRREGLVTGKIFYQKPGIRCEFYNLEEIIAIGFHLKSHIALRIQKHAHEAIQSKLAKAREKLKVQQAQLEYFWDRQDMEDIH